MKLIEPENLKGYEGKLVECQYVEPGHPFGRTLSRNELLCQLFGGLR